MFSPLVGAQVDLKAGQSITLPIASSFEHGVLVDSGLVSVDGNPVPNSHLAFRAQWQSEVVGGGTNAGHFSVVQGYDGPPLPASAMPTVLLKPRG